MLVRVTKGLNKSSQYCRSRMTSLVPRPHPLAYCERGSGPLSWAFEVQVLRNTLINVVLECNDIAVTISVQTLFSIR